MLAYQQLSMEVLNDSVYKAGGATVANELSHPTVELASPDFERYVLPALHQKIRVLERLIEQHRAFGRPTIRKHAELYELFSALFSIMIERGNRQIEDGTEWVANPSSETDPRPLVDVERQATAKSLRALNKFIRKHGFSNDDFLKINCEAFNSVRHSIRLAPLHLEDFTSRYFAGMSGNRARFFSED